MDLISFGLALSLPAAWIMFISRNWRWNLASISLVCLGVSLLLFDIWALEQVAIILVGGWMAVAILGASHQNREVRLEAEDAGSVFRLLVFTLLGLVSWTASQNIENLIPDLDSQLAFAALLLSSSGNLF